MEILSNVSYYSVGTLLAILGISSIILTVLQRVLNYLLGTSRKVTERLVKRVLENKDVKPLIEAAENLPATHDRLYKVESKLDEVYNLQCEERKKNQEAHLALFRNSLIKTYYDLIQQEIINDTMYGSWVDLHALYQNYGGNGSMGEMLRDLQTKRAVDMKRKFGQ